MAKVRNFQPRLIGALLMATLSMGCATSGPAQPAKLATTDAATMTKVRAVLATATGRPRFELGPDDMATSTAITVLPPPLGPLETRSLAVPSVFDITMQGGACVLVARSDGKTYPLRGVRCTRVVAR
jgi:hypothetical protein